MHTNPSKYMTPKQHWLQGGAADQPPQQQQGAHGQPPMQQGAACQPPMQQGAARQPLHKNLH